MRGDQWLEKTVHPGVLQLSGTTPFHTLSSALHGGGLNWKRHILNVQVPHGYTSADPLRDLEDLVRSLGIPLEEAAAMMTAADVDQVVEGYAIGEQFRLRVFVTAGTGNAARAGMPRKTYPGYTAGTINTIAVIDGRITEAAMVNAVLTMTEAKTAALQELAVLDRFGHPATGTTTDAVVIAVTQSSAYSGVHQYAGVATELGNALAMTVHQSLKVALHNKRTWEAQ